MPWESQVVTNPPANAGHMGSIPGLGRFPGKGNGNLFQYSCLENPIDRGAGQATVHRSQRVGHDLVTKKQQQGEILVCISPWLGPMYRVHGVKKFIV